MSGAATSPFICLRPDFGDPMAADLLERMRLFDRIARDSHCTPADKAVAWALLWGFYNGDTGRCDPSLKTIGSRAFVSHRQAKRATKNSRSVWLLPQRRPARHRRKIWSHEYL